MTKSAPVMLPFLGIRLKAIWMMSTTGLTWGLMNVRPDSFCWSVRRGDNALWVTSVLPA